MMIELLQQVGLNKYEAEAYAALLRHGPLTGYELGKRSEVPLSRSYEILERLSAKGLALVQPGDPPRYAAEPPEQFLERTRTATNATLDALARTLAEAGPSPIPEGFWVVRGQDHILAYASTLIARARRTVALQVAPAQSAPLAEALAQARARGCRILPASADTRAEEAARLLLLIDEREGMVGTLAPADRAQAVAGANRAFVAALARSLEHRRPNVPAQAAEPAAASHEPQPLSWLDWEQHKQRQLLNIQHLTN
jgi:HTH-type transcriptional regulator, sugar sensing transcriptional regulator